MMREHQFGSQWVLRGGVRYMMALAEIFPTAYDVGAGGILWEPAAAIINHSERHLPRRDR
jgi:hypothetical protein